MSEMIDAAVFVLTVTFILFAIVLIVGLIAMIRRKGEDVDHWIDNGRG